MNKQVFEMSWQHDHIIERFEAWQKIANKYFGSFEENVEKDRCVGSIVGNQFRFLLMVDLRDIICISVRLDYH